jgi:hypothetical protein
LTVKSLRAYDLGMITKCARRGDNPLSGVCVSKDMLWVG